MLSGAARQVAIASSVNQTAGLTHWRKLASEKPARACNPADRFAFSRLTEGFPVPAAPSLACSVAPTPRDTAGGRRGLCRPTRGDALTRDAAKPGAPSRNAAHDA
jgi:hypothetical protein